VDGVLADAGAQGVVLDTEVVGGGQAAHSDLADVLVKLYGSRGVAGPVQG
jgi:hypothetical protein